MHGKTKGHKPPTPNKTREKKKPNSTLRKIIAFIVLIPTIIVSILLVAATYIAYYPPVTYPLPALLGLAFPIFVVATLLLMLILLWLYPKYASVPFVAMLLSIPGLWLYTPINRGNNRLDTNRDSFSILSYNTFYFEDKELRATGEKATYNRTLQNIINSNADIVVLQEANVRIKENTRHHFTHKQIEQINKQYPYQINKNSGRVMSKYPLRFIDELEHSQTAHTLICEADIDGRKVTIFNNHLESIGLTKDDKQLYLDLTTQPDSINEKIGSVKIFTNKFLKAFSQRAKQVAYIDSLARTIDGNIIMCGDINDTPNSYAYHVLKDGRNEAYNQLCSGPGFTYCADRMWVRIDHIFYEGDMQAQYMHIDKVYSSDHFPLYVEFEWK